MTFRDELLQILTEDQLLCQEPMSRHTTFRVGGPAAYYLRPNQEQLPGVTALCRARGIPVQITGNGSNLLVSDQGFAGAVVEIGQQLSALRVEGTRMTVQAGASLARAAAAAYRASLKGLAFAAGIPGTVGGAVAMNAGAYGGEMKDVLESALVLMPDGVLVSCPAQRLALSYRSSMVQKNGGIVVEAVFSLKPGDQEEIGGRMEELRQKRLEKQPLEYPSAGSTFKRPEGYFAGKLIQDAGLQGVCVGDAQVSEKHCGFIINRGAATATEIWQLIQKVRDTVYDRFGVLLEPEVKLLGEF